MSTYFFPNGFADRQGVPDLSPNRSEFDPDPISFPSLCALSFLTVQQMRYQRAELPLKLDGLAAAREFFSGCFAESDPGRECLWVAHLDNKARCLLLTQHEGDDAGTDFPLRSIIADAAFHGSSAIVLAHNHPSGDPTPSDADKRATRRLACAAEALDCVVADHLVFGGPRCTSFRQIGLL
jgi:DNA repair protein RadC